MTTKQSVRIDSANRMNLRPIANQLDGNRINVQSGRMRRIGRDVHLNGQSKRHIVASLDTFNWNLIEHTLSVALVDRRRKCFGRDGQDVATSITFTGAVGLTLVVHTIAVNVLEREVARRSIGITSSGFLSQRRPNVSLKVILGERNTKCPLLDRLTVPKNRLLGLLVLLDLCLGGVAPHNPARNHSGMKFNSHINLLLR